MKSILLIKKVLGLVEMTSGLVNASYSLQASCKNDFLCTLLFAGRIDLSSIAEDNKINMD